MVWFLGFSFLLLRYLLLHVLLYAQDVDGCPGDADLRSLLQMAIFCIDTPEKHFAKVH